MGKKLVSKIKKILLDILSFGSPQAIVFNLTSILVLLGTAPVSAVKYSPVKCVFKHIILPLIYRGNCPTSGFFANCDGPACGMTRAMSRLLKGRVSEALSFNKGVIIVLVVIVIVLLINCYKWYRYYKKTGKLYEF
ncbi:DUF2752 domain-containing protein [Candidatus Woesearchaeota archaeon]|jgi:hypothetical protein|nr:DUF2752 domain-containing protein [Candidatus Woesearchaeota archaeon]